MRLIAIVGLLLLCLSFCSAGDLAIQTEKLQLQSVVGTLGVAAAAFWPMVQAPDYGLSVGPLVALGTETVVGGLGVRMNISIEFPVLEYVDTGWAGYGYNWVAGSTGWEFGVGKSWEVE